MQTALIRIALSVIFVALRSFVGVAFLPSTTPRRCWGSGSGRGATAKASIIGEPGYQRSSRSPTLPVIPVGRTVTTRSTVHLNAAREDCKSCMEQEIEKQEGIAGNGFDGERRKLLEEEIRQEKSRNVKIALGSFLSAIGLFFLQHNVISPALANPVLLLRTMESTSAPLAVALTNGRPTVVDFYAEWCENCKTMAPRMREIEEQFKNQINFVVVDGSAEENYDLVDAFRVDGIPHLAMVNAKGEVETAIIGIVPKEVVVDDIKAMLADRPLPYTGFDLFEGEDHNIKGQIEMDG